MATSETARDINRRIVLNLIRSHQPISRADLARHSGLQRSTVSVITEQLINERWVTEGAIGHVVRGRRPRFLHLNKERAGIIGINIRPTHTVLALADLDAHFVAQQALPTSRDPEQFVTELGSRIRNMTRMRSEVSYEGIGVSLPGRVDLGSQRLVFAPNLGWKQFDLKTPLEQITGLPVELENAANACALAEVWFGRHTEGVSNLIAVTVSEGIGTGLILNQQLVRGSTGLAGEFGHTTVVDDGIECRCGNRGCWEVYASNTAAVRYYYSQSASNGRNDKSSAKVMGPELAFDDIVRLAKQNDPKAVESINKMAHYLGVGIALLITGLAPDVIVVIGEVTRVWDQVGAVINRVIQERSRTHAVTRIVPTDPSIQPRLQGTIALVLQKHFGAPSVA
ncbi:MAG TPA: ROK family transcriptional regulator [Blastocatellia bacterium]|nr:ROK family transcriptional regulator [Blastocatellia bacterium]